MLKVIASLPSLGILTLAAHTPQNWEVIYREWDVYSNHDIDEIISLRPDIIAFSSLTARINETYRLATKFRSANIKTVIGGLHASAMPDEAMLYADAVIQGEGEYLWEDLLKDFEAGELRSLYSSFQHRRVFHFTESKIPRYDLLDISKYNRLTLQTTRGCPLSCSFCAASRTISNFKKKPVSQVERELNKILEIWPRPFIELADDNTFVDKKWSVDLLKMFSKYDIKWFTETDISIAYDEELLALLAQSGCAQVLIGFETTSAETLRGIDTANWKFKQFENYFKAIDNIQSYGISVNGCFILGFDTDTPETFEATEKFIRQSNLSEVQITLLTPFPGTALYKKLKEEGRLISDNFWDRCTLFDLNFVPKNFSIEELESGFQQLMSAVYSDEAVRDRKHTFRQTLRNKLNLKS